jgi:hypothetical protein
MTKMLSTQATIKDFHWGAPHSSASFVIKGTSRKEEILTLQGAAPGRMWQAGFNPKDMRRGTKVEISWHPLRSGTPGGTLATLKFPDGRVFEDTEYKFTDGPPPVPGPSGAQPPPYPNDELQSGR